MLQNQEIYQAKDYSLFNSMLCGAKLFFSLFSFIFYLETTIFSEKREERKVKSEKYKKKRQSSVENCRFFLEQMTGIEPA